MMDAPSTAIKNKSTKNNLTSSPVSSFLDRAYTELGAHSVVYVAFGTAFFPLPESIDHLNIILEEIVDHGYRLLFALSSLTAKVTGLSTQLVDKMTAAGQAMFPDWTNQTDVLEHPVSVKSAIGEFCIYRAFDKGYPLLHVSWWMELNRRVGGPRRTDDLLAVCSKRHHTALRAIILNVIHSRATSQQTQ